MLFRPKIPADQPPLNWVESPWLRQPRLGRRLMGSRTWYQQVLKPNCAVFAQLFKQPLPTQAAVLDAGCGEGLAFKLIEQHFKPKIVFGLEIDTHVITPAIARAGRLQTPTHVMQGDVALASFKDETFDIIFAHHLVQFSADPTALVHKMAALLKPGGILCSAEFCRVFTQSWRAKLVFRHSAAAQKSADEWVQLMTQAGLSVNQEECQFTRPWWTRRLWGLAQKLGLSDRGAPAAVLLVARKGIPAVGFSSGEKA